MSTRKSYEEIFDPTVNQLKDTLINKDEVKSLVDTGQIAGSDVVVSEEPLPSSVPQRTLLADLILRYKEGDSYPLFNPNMDTGTLNKIENHAAALGCVYGLKDYVEERLLEYMTLANATTDIKAIIDDYFLDFQAIIAEAMGGVSEALSTHLQSVNTGVHGSTNVMFPLSIVARDNNGACHVGPPTEDGHAVTKKYVDDKFLISEAGPMSITMFRSTGIPEPKLASMVPPVEDCITPPQPHYAKGCSGAKPLSALKGAMSGVAGDWYIITDNGIIHSNSVIKGDVLVITANVNNSPLTESNYIIVQHRIASDALRLTAMQVITNKSIDANKNTLSNITVDMLARTSVASTGTENPTNDMLSDVGMVKRQINAIVTENFICQGEHIKKKWFTSNTVTLNIPIHKIVDCEVSFTIDNEFVVIKAGHELNGNKAIVKRGLEDTTILKLIDIEAKAVNTKWGVSYV